MPQPDEKLPGVYSELDHIIYKDISNVADGLNVFFQDPEKIPDTNMITKALYTAIFHHRAACLRFLIEQASQKNISLDVTHPKHGLLLRYAVQQGHTDCIKMLILAGARLPLELFKIQTFLQADVLRKVVSENSFELFNKAICSDHPLTEVEKIIKKGYSANCASITEKTTPLMIAVKQSNDLLLILRLLKAGASIKSKNLYNKTVFNLCDEKSKVYGFLDLIVNSLQDKNEKFSSELEGCLKELNTAKEKLQFLDCVVKAITNDFMHQYTAQPGNIFGRFFLGIRDHAPNSFQSRHIDIARGFYKKIAASLEGQQAEIDFTKSPTVKTHDSPYRQFSKGDTKTLKKMRKIQPIPVPMPDGDDEPSDEGKIMAVNLI